MSGRGGVVGGGRTGRRPVRLGELLSRYLQSVGLDEVEDARRLAEAWRSAVPEKFHAETRLLRMRSGVLEVGVTSSALLFELDGFRRPEILARLREQAIGHVRDLKFKLDSSSREDGE